MRHSPNSRDLQSESARPVLAPWVRRPRAARAPQVTLDLTQAMPGWMAGRTEKFVATKIRDLLVNTGRKLYARGRGGGAAVGFGFLVFGDAPRYLRCATTVYTGIQMALGHQVHA